MPDIVWSLRNDVRCSGDIGCADELCNKAADEIQRLRRAFAEAIKYALDASVEPGLTMHEHMLAWKIAIKMRNAMEGK